MQVEAREVVPAAPAGLRRVAPCMARSSFYVASNSGKCSERHRRPWEGEGYRKLWARLRVCRVWRLRENNLPAASRTNPCAAINCVFRSQPARPK